MKASSSFPWRASCSCLGRTRDIFLEGTRYWPRTDVPLQIIVWNERLAAFFGVRAKQCLGGHSRRARWENLVGGACPETNAGGFESLAVGDEAGGSWSVAHDHPLVVHALPTSYELNQEQPGVIMLPRTLSRTLPSSPAFWGAVTPMRRSDPASHHRRGRSWVD